MRRARRRLGRLMTLAAIGLTAPLFPRDGE